jgi:tripartite-type tricarboxylate transporter receptor subunit TctC
MNPKILTRSNPRKGSTFAARTAVLAACAAFALCTFDARAQDFYKGKRLTLLIGSGAGGPTDLEGRLFAKYLVRHIDGHPNVLVQNKDGAGGLLGPSYLGEVGPRDGSMLGYFSASAWLYVSNPEHWRVDFKTYEFIAYQPGTTINFMRTDVPPGMHVPRDIAKAKGLVAGGLTADNPKDLKLRLALDMLRVPYTYVTGYRTNMPARLAMQRGEINIFSESPPSYRAVIEPSLVKTGEMMPVWYDDVDLSGAAPVPKSMQGLSIPTFPQLHEMIRGSMPSGPLWEAFRTIFNVNSTLQRIVTLPPGAPPAAAEALRSAVARLNEDREFAAEAMRTIEFAPDFETGPDIAARVRGMLVASPEVRMFVANYIKSAGK